ncbi:telomere binding protein [Rhizina undulata]
MDSLLTSIRSSSASKQDDEPFLTISSSSKSKPRIIDLEPEPSIQATSLSNNDDILIALRSKPSTQTLREILQNLLIPNSSKSVINIFAPSPKSSLIVKTLLEVTLPDFWYVLDAKQRESFARCLRSMTGLGGVLSTLKSFISVFRSKPEDDGTKRGIEELLEVLQMCLEGGGKKQALVYGLWERTQNLESETNRNIIWKELVSLLSGKILSIAAEAEILLGRDTSEHRWVGVGKLYTGWLGKEIAKSALKLGDDDEAGQKALALLAGKAFGLGYADDLVEGLTYSLLHPKEELQRLRTIISHLPAHDKRTYILTLLRVVPKKHLSSNLSAELDEKWWENDAHKVAGAAALIDGVISEDDDLREILVEWLLGTSGGGVGEPIGIRRALVAILNKDELTFRGVLEKSLQQFADKLWIKHTPIMRQEVNVQLLLLCAGSSHRRSPTFLTKLARSSTFLNGVSNRLGASSTRAKFLGMIVGESLSALVDKEGNKMSFGVEETATEEALWWKSIINVEDRIGSLEDLEAHVVPKKRKKENQPKPKVPASTSSVVQVIEEIEEEESEDDDLMPYAKPDSDAEDSEEDPTMVNRKKDTAPVYIRNLISMLRDTESYDRQQLALKSAASLIRRKAKFGKELQDHSEELLSLLVGLNDKYDMESFQEMRMQALIAMVVALPQTVGPSLVRGFFEGDYSMGQRAGILSAIGMGARELAGFSDTDLPLSLESSKGKSGSEELFPSKMLPKKLHDKWADPKGICTPLDAVASGLEKMMIQPMAAKAADKLTGPNVLKVRTFSSRMEVEKKKAKPAASKLGTVVAEAFFFPLTGRYWVALKDYGGQGIYFEPFLLTTYLKTLAIILHASGPSTLTLPQMTAELWDLIFSLRRQTIDVDSGVLEAILFALLTLLEVNEADKGKRLVEDHSRELVETQELVDALFEATSEEKVRYLAASVLVRVREVMETYQKRLMGEMLSLEG